MTVYANRIRELTDTIWSVVTSFGFSETEIGEDGKITPVKGEKLFSIGKNEAEVASDTVTAKERAQIAAVCVEIAAACGLEDFTVSVCDVEIYDLLVLFGFEEHLRLDESEDGGFTVSSGGQKIAGGTFSESDSRAAVYFSGLLNAIDSFGIVFGAQEVQKSLIFAEPDAEGAAYDIAFNLRINGCIVEYFTADGNIDAAEKYALENGHSCIIRVFADGKIMIKDFLKNEITETTIADFLGFYGDEDGCDCGHDHHDGCDCGCGHHHGH